MQCLVSFTDNLNRALSDTTKGNVCFSPAGIMSLLRICYYGAEGETKNGLGKLFDATANDRMETAKSELFSTWQVQSMADDSNFELTSCSAAWPDRTFQIWAGFRAAIGNYDPGFQINEVDYRNETQRAIVSINSWCAHNTNDRIKEIVSSDSVTSETAIVLTNAVYFAADWKTQFDKTKTTQRPFTNHSGTFDAQTMVAHKLEVLGYLDTGEYQVVTLPYVGDRLAMTIVLPEEIGVDATENPAQLWRSLAPRDGSALMPTKINLYMPKFEFETEYELSEQFREMGAERAFSDGADFTSMTPNSMRLEKVIHKVYVRCDEQGTEAAAATAMTAKRAIDRTRTMDVNRPFLFFIHTTVGNELVFFGKVNSPEWAN